MGLGKTAQSTAVLEHIRLTQLTAKPFMVVAPLTTLGHWKREIETWTDMVCPSPEPYTPKPSRPYPCRASVIVPLPFSPLCPRLCFPRPSHWLAATEPATLSVPLCLCACKTQLPPGGTVVGERNGLVECSSSGE